MANKSYAIQLQNVSKVFTTESKGKVDGFTALQNVALSIRAGEFVSLVGPSGCGKSTVLNLVAGLNPVSAGRVYVGDKQVNALNIGVGYITQEDNLFPWRTMLENIAYGLELKGIKAKERRERVQPLIDRVGLQGFEQHFPHQLSGGMRKRAAILRTLVLNPDIILMDEPFGPLDAQTRTLLQQELLDLWEGTGKTIVFVTHDLVESLSLSDRVVVFTRSPGRIKAMYPVGFPRPREVLQVQKSREFQEMHDQIWSDIRTELVQAP
ncbi:ABC transporter ATP-binding protein [Paenibacillus sp. S150]|uniref:ABC transporter ATP-binding protein n=1 Tax=Paenibacillus sp. S150 TaxID=2749826 RepID=UPI001C597D92|nr:ABC transporter ATP-binding protein [Paenibacillus sp. S150]MBW4082000.1 ABC transporter ATP-binding protein [Paenibacillus sp. S150]